MVVEYTRKKRLSISWWQWGLTVMGFIYAGFVLAAVAAFMAEDALKAALVMGIVLGFVAIVWGVLLARFVFLRAKPVTAENTGGENG